jgi:hypothetical protein
MRTAHHSKLSAHAHLVLRFSVRTRWLSQRCAVPRLSAVERLHGAAYQIALLLCRRTSATFTHSRFTVARPSLARSLRLCLCAVR